MITLKEYAIRHKKDPSGARQMAGRGSFKTAVKMGRDWMIDENEPYPDRRVKSGKYIHWRNKTNKKENEQ